MSWMVYDWLGVAEVVMFVVVVLLMMWLMVWLMGRRIDWCIVRLMM